MKNKEKIESTVATSNNVSVSLAAILMKRLCISIMHSKGGCGKSEIAALTADALQNKYGTENLKIYDNDSETPKLSGYLSAKAEHIQLYKLDSRGHVKAESLDINKMFPVANELEHSNKSIVLVDNGSPSFQPFISFFQADAVDMYREIGVDFLIVTVVTADKITHKAPIELLSSYGSSVKYIVIENEHFGEVTFDDSFFESAEVDYSIFKMEKLTSAQNTTVMKVRDKNLLLSEAIISKEFSLVEKSRLKTVKKAFDIPFLSIIEEYGNV